MSGKRVLIMILLAALSARLFAEDPLPAITGVTVIVETADRGYVSSGPMAFHQILRLNFHIFVTDLALVFPNITSVKVVIPGGLEWTINKDTYSNLKAGYLGGWGYWKSGNAPWAISPIDMKAVITFQDNRKVEKAFHVISEPEKTGGITPLFLITDDFDGAATPYHYHTPSPAKVQSVAFEGTTLSIDFTVNDARIRHGQIYVYDEQGVPDGWSPSFSVSEQPPAWLNGGQGFYNDGRLNRVRIDLSELKPKADSKVTSVGVTTWDEVDPQTNLLRTGYQFIQRSGRWQLTPPGSPLVGASAEYQASLVSPRPAVSEPIWDDSNRAAWALRLEGILGTLNGDQFTGLAPYGATPANRDNIDAMLSSSWGVVDRATLLDAMKNLRDKGHRSRFARQVDLIRKNPQDSDQALADNVAATEGWSAPTMTFVRAFAPTVGDRGLLAWDLCRLVMLARDGRFLGYLTDDEAWSWIYSAADQLREAYDSWADLGESFLVGRMYWGNQSRAADLYLQARTALLDLLKPEGEWGKTPWPPRKAASLDYTPAGL